MRESRQNDEQIYHRKPLTSQQSSAMLEIWQSSASRAQTRVVGAEGWGLLIFDWFILSMRMQVILDSPFARPGSVPMWGAGRKESSGTGLVSTLPCRCQVHQAVQNSRALHRGCQVTIKHSQRKFDIFSSRSKIKRKLKKIF